MTTTRNRLASPPRPCRPVELPGGLHVHVRDLTLREIRAIETRAGEAPDGPDRNIRSALLLAAYALAEPDGQAAYPEASEADLELLSLLTLTQIEAIGRAVVPSRADAKNG